MILGGRAISQYEKLIPLAGEFTCRVAEHISVRVYQDARPRNLELAELQKGLILVLGGREAVEEGAGFGTPVVIYDEPYFSTTAEVYANNIDGRIKVSKHFIMDAVSRKQLWNGPFIRQDSYNAVHNAFTHGYTKSGKLKPFFDAAMLLLHNLGLRTRFVKVKPMGKVVVDYDILEGCVQVRADFAGVDPKGWSGSLLLNEQGPGFFKGCNCNGRVLREGELGGWEEIMGGEACLMTDGCLGAFFGLTSKGGSKLYLGREKIQGRFAWIGLDYHLPPTRNFSYNIMMGLKPKHGSGRRSIAKEKIN